MSRAERKKRVKCNKCGRIIQKGSIKRHLLTAYHDKRANPV
jgi:ribosomal protein L35